LRYFLIWERTVLAFTPIKSASRLLTSVKRSYISLVNAMPPQDVSACNHSPM
jgi:hypothetical protein